MKNLALFNLCMLMCIAACMDRSGRKEVFDDENSQRVKLLEEKIWLRLPRAYIRSSKYRLEKQLQVLMHDSVSVEMVQRSLEILEFADEPVDVFIDTAESFAAVSIMNTKQMLLSKSAIKRLMQVLEEGENRTKERFPELEIDRLQSYSKRGKGKKMLKFKYKIHDERINTTFFRSLYFLSTKKRTFGAVEISINSEDLEDYLWSIDE